VRAVVSPEVVKVPNTTFIYEGVTKKVSKCSLKVMTVVKLLLKYIVASVHCR